MNELDTSQSAFGDGTIQTDRSADNVDHENSRSDIDISDMGNNKRPVKNKVNKKPVLNKTDAKIKSQVMHTTDHSQNSVTFTVEPKQREFVQCGGMGMITKITQMLDLIQRSGYDLT